jgi:hypothetical protein
MTARFSFISFCQRNLCESRITKAKPKRPDSREVIFIKTGRSDAPHKNGRRGVHYCPKEWLNDGWLDKPKGR